MAPPCVLCACSMVHSSHSTWTCHMEMLLSATARRRRRQRLRNHCTCKYILVFIHLILLIYCLSTLWLACIFAQVRVGEHYYPGWLCKWGGDKSFFCTRPVDVRICRLAGASVLSKPALVRRLFQRQQWGWAALVLLSVGGTELLQQPVGIQHLPWGEQSAQQSLPHCLLPASGSHDRKWRLHVMHQNTTEKQTLWPQRGIAHPNHDYIDSLWRKKKSKGTSFFTYKHNNINHNKAGSTCGSKLRLFLSFVFSFFFLSLHICPLCFSPKTKTYQCEYLNHAGQYDNVKGCVLNLPGRALHADIQEKLNLSAYSCLSEFQFFYF